MVYQAIKANWIDPMVYQAITQEKQSETAT